MIHVMFSWGSSLVKFDGVFCLQLSMKVDFVLLKSFKFDWIPLVDQLLQCAWILQGIYETCARACTRFPHTAVKSSKRVRACTQIFKIGAQIFEMRAYKSFFLKHWGLYYQNVKFEDNPSRISTEIYNFIERC